MDRKLSGWTALDMRDTLKPVLLRDQKGSILRSSEVRVKALAIALLSALLAIATITAAEAAKGKKKKPKVFVSQVSDAPKQLQVGDTFETTGKVKNKGKKSAKKVKVRVVISGGEFDGTKLGSTSIKGKIKKKKSKSFALTGTIKDSLDPGAGGDPYAQGGPYKLEACVKAKKAKEKCKKLKGKLTILPSTVYTPGSKSLGDELFPQIGNGGYDALNYEIDLDYDPTANTFAQGTKTTITAVATKNLSEFSFDFQDLDVSSVTVNGAEATFTQADATPEFAPGSGATQPQKLTVTPAEGIDEGTEFEVVVNYQGTPVRVIDADTSSEGWIPACYPLAEPQTCDGAFVVNEPIGAQGWFPSNNYPTDKATFTTKITVPGTHTAFGVGELAANTNNGDGTRTWTWTEDDQSATYLTTATSGLFDNDFGQMTEFATGETLEIYNAIDSSATPLQKTTITGTLAEQPGQLNFLTDVLGPYPFDSMGGIADKAAGVGYALEVQTKAHYAGGFSTGNPNINIGTQLHEIAHQWMGNSISPATWHEIWFNEGWAEFLTVYWAFETGQPGAVSPAQFFDDIYNTPDASDWDLAPAVLDNDPANLFSGFAVYDRPGAMMAGYYEIVGNNRFFSHARQLLSLYGYGNITLDQYVDSAVTASGFTGADEQLLRDYFQQWLFSTDQPTITPADF
jgi:hypothetical protein